MSILHILYSRSGVGQWVAETGRVPPLKVKGSPLGTPKHGHLLLCGLPFLSQQLESGAKFDSFPSGLNRENVSLSIL